MVNTELTGRKIKYFADYNILNIVVNTELMRIYSPAPKHYNILNIIINTDYYL